MTNSRDAERIVLLNAEEDYGLLWQILGEVRDAMPGAAPEAALGAARAAVRSLVRAGKIEVYRRASRRDPFVRLDAAEGAAAVDADAYWSADGRDEAEVAVAAVEKP